MSETPTMYPATTGIPTFSAGKTLPKSFHACPNREAALLYLCHSKPAHLDRLLALSSAEWRKVLHWLDVSGLCLYLADRIEELSLQGKLPADVMQRLQQNLADNRARIQGLLRESEQIQAEFERANICYAVLKGFSLCGSSVPKPELRHQLDVDYLVNESGAPEARKILERAGYRFYGVSGRTWEFKKDERLRFTTKNMYKDGFGRTVELHVEPAVPDRESLLSRREYREIEGVRMPVLAPADLFLRQAMHVFKDVCSSFLRASHLLEFYRHVCARADDHAFWSEVRSLAGEDPRTIFGLGVILNLIESVMDGEVPAKLVTWTLLRIPDPAQRWVTMYGPNCVYGTPPGTKLYLLLQREMEEVGIFSMRPAMEALLPTRLPKPFIAGRADETLTFRLTRYGMRFRYILLRLRFHVVEGVRYAWASYRWRSYRGERSA